MDVKFLERLPKALSKEEKDKRYKNELMGLTDEQEGDEPEFIYKPSVINIHDVVSFKSFDPDHTLVRDKWGFVMIFKCKFSLFQFIKETLGGKITHDVDNFAIQEKFISKMEKFVPNLDNFLKEEDDSGDEESEK